MSTNTKQRNHCENFQVRWRGRWRGDAGSRGGLSDDGPGLPQSPWANLFQPFMGSARATGLGRALDMILTGGRGAAVGPQGIRE